MDFFPDAQHVDAIRRALWTRNGAGKAVAMIGAGMSLNATARRPGLSCMSTWSSLVNAMIDRLYPKGGGNSQQRKALTQQAGATSVAMRLADEFSAAFGRAALDEFILTNTPDQDFSPGLLHRMLIDLPWADILTTNYDTLLERAAEEGFGRRYSIIRSPAEIPSASSPRIVKLHGSFPSTRPFIFGEEDFRTYPQRFAAFVNLARQSSLENILCLIGFSGDDPNFLAWTGWVRDQLADYSPRIYLCGLLNLSNSQRSVLQSRGVVPVDLSPLFSMETVSERVDRHSQAIEWLLASLQHGRPYNPMEWPKAPTVEAVSTIGKHKLLASIHIVPQKEMHSPSDDKAQGDKSPVEQLIAISGIWSKNREIYPGWLIAPEDVRNVLEIYTSNIWEDFFLQHRASLDATAALAFLYEFNWRNETALLPIWDHLVQTYEQILESINPFPGRVADIIGTPLVPGILNDDQYNWKSMRQQWLAVACSLLRYYREERKWSDFNRWEIRLNSVKEFSADAHARLCYERCLRGLSLLDDEAVQIALKDWPKETHDLFWGIRRAGIMAELGNTYDAASLVSSTLDRIRFGLEDTFYNIPALSREGWALWLAMGIENASTYRSEHFDIRENRRRIVRERFRQLRVFGADPDDLKEGLELRLQGPAPVVQPVTQERLGFEPNRVSSKTTSGDGLSKKLLPAYQYMRLCEESGIPPSIGSIIFTKNNLKNAADWFREFDLVRTQSLLFRLLDKEVTDAYLTRHRLASLSLEVIDNWRKSCFEVIRRVLPSVGRDHHDKSDIERRNRDRLQTAVTVLSRVAVRCSENEISEIWDIFITMYKSEECRLPMSGKDFFEPLLNNLIGNSPINVLAMRLRSLFDLPLPGEPAFEVSRQDYWPDPASEVGFRLLRMGWKPPKNEWQSLIDKLINAFNSDKMVVRTSALYRLYTLYRLNLLKRSDSVRAGNAFWLDSKYSDTLPIDKWRVLALQYALVWIAPSRVDAHKLVKQHLLNHEIGQLHMFGNQGQWFDDLLMFSDVERVLPASERLTWSLKDRKQILGILQKWWAVHGSKQAADYSNDKDSLIFSRSAFGRFIVNMWDIVRDLVLIQSKGSDSLFPVALKFIKDLDQAKLPIGSVMPAVLRFEPALFNSVASIIRKEMTSSQTVFRHSALRGLVYWADAHRQKPSSNPLPLPPADIIHELGAAVAMRNSSDLRLLLNAACAILKRQLGWKDKKFVKNLLIGLDYLFSETQYRDRKGNVEAIPYESVPSVRRECVRIARCLADTGHENDERVKRWLDAANCDPLPEIRTASKRKIIFDD